MGRFEVRVCGARNIGDVQAVGKPDPYVRITLGEEKARLQFRTRTIDNSFNPEWNEVVKFQIADYDREQVLFEVCNENVFKDDILGSYRLSVNGMQRGVMKDAWVILTGTKKASAELHLHLLAVDFGRDPDPGSVVVQSIEEGEAKLKAGNTSSGGGLPTAPPPTAAVYAAPPPHFPPQPQAVMPVPYQSPPPPPPPHASPYPVYAAPVPQPPVATYYSQTTTTTFGNGLPQPPPPGVYGGYPPPPPMPPGQGYAPPYR